MPTAPAWMVNNGSVFSIGTSPKTILNLIAGSAEAIRAIASLSVSIDDAAARVLVEICESTQATAGTPGTSGAASVVKQVRGFMAADSTNPTWTHGGNYSAEPTALTRLWHARFLGPGPFVVQFPLGRELQSLLSGSTKYKALAIRLTASVTVNADCTVEVE